MKPEITPHVSRFTFHVSRLTFHTLAMVALLLLTAGLYARSVGFGFLWDDPPWYGRVIGKSVWELFLPQPTYHFYRPGHLLYNRLFVTGDVISPAPLHIAQIGWHLLNIALTYRLCRRLKLGRWVALTAAGLEAWLPFSYQAVAWAAPAQPMTGAFQSAACLLYLQADPRRRSWRAAVVLSMLCYAAALAVQESSVLFAPLPILLEWAARRPPAEKSAFFRVFPRPKIIVGLLYPALALVFGLLWLAVPRRAGFTRLNFQPQIPLYLLQAFIFPLLGRPAGYAPDATFPPALLVALGGLTLLWLLESARRNGRLRAALVGLAWAILGLALPLVGLRYSYVSVSSRLFYPAGAGVALLWGCALWPSAARPRLARLGGAALVVLIALQSLLLLRHFEQLYLPGVAHLNELTQAIQSEASAGRERLLFVNFPDRYAPKRPPYPVGYWGVTLAPIVVDLGEFSRIRTGQMIPTTSRSAPYLDAAAREAGPFRVDMRGEITPPEEIYRLARESDAVYLSRYSADGRFTLRRACRVMTVSNTAECRLAHFGPSLCLDDLTIERAPGELLLTLTWRSLAAAQPNDTVFAHLGMAAQPPLAQADNDPCLGLLPLGIWRPGDSVRERRSIPLSETISLNEYEVRVGVYNRLSGARLPAFAPDGARLPDDVYTVKIRVCVKFLRGWTTRTPFRVGVEASAGTATAPTRLKPRLQTENGTRNNPKDTDFQ